MKMPSFLMSLCLIIFLLHWSAIAYDDCEGKDRDECENFYSADYLKDVYYSGLRRITQKAKTKLCKQQIEFEFMKHFRALAEESPYPFEDIYYHTQCLNNKHPAPIPVRKNYKPVSMNDSTPYLPVRNDSVNPDNLAIAFAVLTHSEPEFTMRIINALDEPQHFFIIHVDAKADEVYHYLQNVTAERKNIQLLPNDQRENCNWGGFSIVNATLNCLRYIFVNQVYFDYFIDISGTTYPIKSNHFIKKKLSTNLNAVYMEVSPEPARPEPFMWNHFVECDNALHRIARLPLIKGINMYVGSQWFAIPRHLAYWYLASILPRDYIFYAKYLIIADENYFSTMFMNSPYCDAERKTSLVFVLFDKWENERNDTKKPMDPRKCLGVDGQCGRSPTTLTMEYKFLIESSRSMFARKFDPKDDDSMALLDYIDVRRGTFGNISIEERDRWDENKGLIGKMVMVVTGKQNLTIDSGENWEDVKVDPFERVEQCLTFSTEKSPYLLTMDCNHSNHFQWFEVGRCTPGYELVLETGKCPTFRSVSPIVDHVDSAGFNNDLFTTSSDNSTIHSKVNQNVYCSLAMKYLPQETCMDIAGENPGIGSPLISYGCTGKWNQLFKLHENCSISVTQPEVIGRVRGYPGDVTRCLEHDEHNRIVRTSECPVRPTTIEHEEGNKINDSVFSSISSSTSAVDANAEIEVEASGETDTYRFTDGRKQEYKKRLMEYEEHARKQYFTLLPEGASKEDLIPYKFIRKVLLPVE